MKFTNNSQPFPRVIALPEITQPALRVSVNKISTWSKVGLILVVLVWGAFGGEKVKGQRSEVRGQRPEDAEMRATIEARRARPSTPVFTVLPAVKFHQPVDGGTVNGGRTAEASHPQSLIPNPQSAIQPPPTLAKTSPTNRELPTARLQAVAGGQARPTEGKK